MLGGGGEKGDRLLPPCPHPHTLSGYEFCSVCPSRFLSPTFSTAIEVGILNPAKDCVLVSDWLQKKHTKTQTPNFN